MALSKKQRENILIRSLIGGVCVTIAFIGFMVKVSTPTPAQIKIQAKQDAIDSFNDLGVQVCQNYGATDDNEYPKKDAPDRINPTNLKQVGPHKYSVDCVWENGVTADNVFIVSKHGTVHLDFTTEHP